MSIKTIIHLPAPAAPNRRHYAVPALLFAKAVKRSRFAPARAGIVPSSSDRLATSFFPRLLVYCLPAPIRCARSVFAAPVYIGTGMAAPRLFASARRFGRV